MKGVLLVNDRL